MPIAGFRPIIFACVYLMHLMFLLSGLFHGSTGTLGEREGPRVIGFSAARGGLAAPSTRTAIKRIAAPRRLRRPKAAPRMRCACSASISELLCAISPDFCSNRFASTANIPRAEDEFFHSKVLGEGGKMLP